MKTEILVFLLLSFSYGLAVSIENTTLAPDEKEVDQQRPNVQTWGITSR